MTATNALEREFTLTRILNAPRDLVFQAWTDPKYLQWFFNDGAPPPTEPIVVDLRVGGAWRQKIVFNEDTEFYTGGVYREIVPGEKLVFTWGASGGWPEIDHDHLEDNPLVTVTLNEFGEKTEMIVHFALPEHASDERIRKWIATDMRKGWGDAIDRLVARFAGVGSN